MYLDLNPIGKLLNLYLKKPQPVNTQSPPLSVTKTSSNKKQLSIKIITINKSKLFKISKAIFPFFIIFFFHRNSVKVNNLVGK